MARGRARDPDQARGPTAQPARRSSTSASRSRCRRRRRRSRSTRRSRTDSVSTRSSGSSRTSRSRRCTRASTTRSRRWSPSAAPTARNTWPRRPRSSSAELDEGRHPRGDLGPREALLLHLRQDGQEGPRVQRDLRPHRDARDRRARRRGGNARLLRRARPHPLALEADARPLQGLHRDAEVQRLPLAAHDRDRAGGAAARDPGAHARDARDRPSTAIAAHWRYKGGSAQATDEAWETWVQPADGRPSRTRSTSRGEFKQTFRDRPLRRGGATSSRRRAR